MSSLFYSVRSVAVSDVSNHARRLLHLSQGGSNSSIVVVVVEQGRAGQGGGYGIWIHLTYIYIYVYTCFDF